MSDAENQGSDVVLMSVKHRSLHKVRLARPGVLAAVCPPVCGSCHLYESGFCRENRAKVRADDVSCSVHRWSAGHNELLEMVDELRRHPENPACVVALSREFHEAQDGDVAHFEAAEKGLRPDVRLSAMTTERTFEIPAAEIAKTMGGFTHVTWCDDNGNYREPRPVKGFTVTAG